MTAVMERATTLPVGTVWAASLGRRFPTLGQRAIDFIQQHCRLTKGRWRGDPFDLFAWQKKFLYQLFEIDPDTGRRRYRWAYLEVPKKNGKTEMIAAIDLFLLLADDEESPEIACGSNSDEQADLVFGAARAMCELSPTLAPLVECYRREIIRRDNPAAKIIRVSAKAKTNDGRNLSSVTLDELHEFDESGEQLFNVLTNGVAARQQPLTLMITTAGWDLETLCGRMHEHALKILSGEVTDPAFFPTIYAAPDPDVNIDDDAAFERALRIANPSMDKIIDLAFYRDERRKGAANTKRYYLDLWTAALNQWLPDGAWTECLGQAFDLRPDVPTFVGVDASTKRDTTAVVACQWDQESIPIKGAALPTELMVGNPFLRVKSRVWERPIEPATGKPVEGWRLPLAEVEQHLRDLHSRCQVQAVAYDPAFVTWMALKLEDDGLPMIEVPQTDGRMKPPTQALYELILDRRLIHDGDPTLARHIRNAVAKQIEGGQRLTKKGGRPNDAAIALVMAVGEAMRREPEPDGDPAIILLEDL
jgi:phage terminase large subunit-like protein